MAATDDESAMIIDQLRTHVTAGAADVIRRRVPVDEEVLGLRMRDVFETARSHDRAAPRVVGGYLAGRDLDPLHRLAASEDPLRRRTAITAPLYFTRTGSPDDLAGGFAIATALACDPEPVVSNAVGIFLKHAGQRAPESLHSFLDENAGRMPRAALRLAIEKLAPAERRGILRGE